VNHRGCSPMPLLGIFCDDSPVSSQSKKEGF